MRRSRGAYLGGAEGGPGRTAPAPSSSSSPQSLRYCCSAFRVDPIVSLPGVSSVWRSAPTRGRVGGGGGGRDALEGKGLQRRPQKRLGRRLEEVAKAVGGGYCRLQMPLRLALGVRETVGGHRLGALEGGGYLPPFQCITGGGGRGGCRAAVRVRVAEGGGGARPGLLGPGVPYAAGPGGCPITECHT